MTSTVLAPRAEETGNARAGDVISRASTEQCEPAMLELQHVIEETAPDQEIDKIWQGRGRAGWRNLPYRLAFRMPEGEKEAFQQTATGLMVISTMAKTLCD